MVCPVGLVMPVDCGYNHSVILDLRIQLVMYRVKEIFSTIQGEGYNAGTAATFLRFAGCNLWSGLEKDRSKGPGSCSAWCDTDFIGGERYTLDELVEAVMDTLYPTKLIVCTGGEPLIQLDKELSDALHYKGYRLAVETNGTIIPKCQLDWVCVSPKAGTPVNLTWGNELKFIYPQTELEPSVFETIKYAYDHLFIQPMDGPNLKLNTEMAVEFVKNNPQWKLSLQTHKYINIP